MSKGGSQLLFFLAHFCVYFILVMIFLKLSFNEHRLFAFRFLRRLIQRSCEPEVANSNIALLIDKDIGRLDIPMNHMRWMHKMHGANDVVNYDQNVFFIKHEISAILYQRIQILSKAFLYQENVFK